MPLEGKSEGKTPNAGIRWPRPRLVVSRCLEFERCRFNGGGVASETIAALRKWADFITPCPEVDVGLGVPREPVRMIVVPGGAGEPGGGPAGGLALVQPATKRDLTADMMAFSGRFLASLPEVDGFVLKAKSPSCGVSNARVYTSADAREPGGRSAPGFFAAAVKERFPDHPMEDEGRLTEFENRQDFLGRIFTLARWREAAEAAVAGAAVGGSGASAVMEFQAENKLLLMAWDQVTMRKLGKIAANEQKAAPAEVVVEYGPLLRKALKERTRSSAISNTLQHAIGYFKDDLSGDEKQHFLDLLEKYRTGRAGPGGLSPLRELIHSWAIKYRTGYLLSQTFLAPFPPELLAIGARESGGR